MSAYPFHTFPRTSPGRTLAIEHGFESENSFTLPRGTKGSFEAALRAAKASRAAASLGGSPVAGNNPKSISKLGKAQDSKSPTEPVLPPRGISKVPLTTLSKDISTGLARGLPGKSPEISVCGPQPSPEPQIDDIDIRASWTGRQGDAVGVQICIQITAQPGTQHFLIDGTHPLVEEAVVTNIRALDPLPITPHKRPLSRVAHQGQNSTKLDGTTAETEQLDLTKQPIKRQSSSNNLSGATLRLSDTRQPFAILDPHQAVHEGKNLRPPVKKLVFRSAENEIRSPERRQLAGFWREVTSSPKFEAESARKRWKEIRNQEKPFAGERTMLDPNRVDSQDAPRDSTEISPSDEGSSEFDIGGGDECSVCHSPARRESCIPHGGNHMAFAELEVDDMDFSSPVRKVSSPPAGKQDISNTPFQLKSVERPELNEIMEEGRSWSVAPERDINLVNEVGVRMSQSQEGERKMFRGSVSPRAVERRAVILKSAPQDGGAMVQMENLLDVRKRTLSDLACQARDTTTIGRAGGRYIAFLERNRLAWESPHRKGALGCLSRMEEGRAWCKRKSHGKYVGEQDLSSPLDFERTTDDDSSEHRRLEDKLSDDSYDEVSLHDSSCLSAPEDLDSPERIASPSVAPISKGHDLGINCEQAKALSPRCFEGSVATLEDEDFLPPAYQKHPTWQKEDEQLSIIFSDIVKPGVYEVDILANIQLTAPGKLNRQLFFIPGLPCLKRDPERFRTGGVSFFIEHPSDPSEVPAIRFNPGTVNDFKTKDSSHLVGRFRLDEELILAVRTKMLVQYIKEFQTATFLHAVPTWSPEKGGQIQYRVKVTCDIKDTDIFANAVEMRLVIRHGSASSQMHVLQRGGYHLDLGEQRKGKSIQVEDEATITIQRDAEDLRKQFDISFSVPFAMDSMLRLPTFRPYVGRSFCETIIVSKPGLPLVLAKRSPGSLSTWKSFQYILEELAYIRLDRLRMPNFFPKSLRDDPMIHITELDCVLFNGLEVSECMTAHPVDIARHLHMYISQNSQDHRSSLQCAVEVDVQVGKSRKILVIDRGMWDAEFALIDNQVATEEMGEWRETADGNMTLFKTEDMKPGQIIHIELSFSLRNGGHLTEGKELGEGCPDELPLDIDQPLPNIVGKTVLIANVEAGLEECYIGTIDQSMSEGSAHVLGRNGEHKVHFPKLTPAYSLFIKVQRSAGAGKAGEPLIVEAPQVNTEQVQLTNDASTNTEVWPNESITEKKPWKSSKAKINTDVQELNAENQPPIVSQNPPQHHLGTKTTKGHLVGNGGLLFLFLFACFCLFYRQGTQTLDLHSWLDGDIFHDLYWAPSALIQREHSPRAQNATNMSVTRLDKVSKIPEQLSRIESVGNTISSVEKAKIGTTAAPGNMIKAKNLHREWQTGTQTSLNGAERRKLKSENVRDWIDHALGWRGQVS